MRNMYMWFTPASRVTPEQRCDLAGQIMSVPSRLKHHCSCIVIGKPLKPYCKAHLLRARSTTMASVISLLLRLVRPGDAPGGSPPGGTGIPVCA